MIESSDKSNKTRLNWAEVFWTVCWVWYLDRWHLGNRVDTDMKFVKNFTPPDFQAKNFTPSISPNFNSFSDKNTKKWVKMEKFTPLAKILHCRRQWREWQIPPLINMIIIVITIIVLPLQLVAWCPTAHLSLPASETLYEVPMNCIAMQQGCNDRDCDCNCCNCCPSDLGI